MLSRDQLSALLKEFQSADSDNSGKVQASSVENALSKAKISTSAEQDEALLLLRVDAESGTVDYSRLRDESELAANRTPPQPVKTMSQTDLVFKAISELRALFNKFDIGALSIQGLRNSLLKLGLKENDTVKELFRHPYEMTFNQLVQALTKVDVAPVLPQPINNGGFKPVRRNLFGDVRTTVPHRYPDPENRDANMLSSDGFKHPNAEVFMTTAQASSSPIKGKPQPETSAGYDTRDKGILRQQVHAAIRKLDAAEMDSKAFLRKMNDLGLKPSETIWKLIEKQKTGTQIPFKDWVKAFEPFFLEATFPEVNQEEQESQLGTKTAASESESRMKGRGSSAPAYGGVAFPGHPLAETKVDNIAMRRQLYPSQQRQSINILVPTLEDNEPPLSTQKTARGFTSRSLASSQPNFLAWDEEDRNKPHGSSKPIRGLVGSASSHPTGRAAPFAFEGEVVPVKSITGVPRSPYKREHHRIPFGTEADYAASFANGVAPSFG